MKLDIVPSRKEIYLPKLSNVSRKKRYVIFDTETDLIKIGYQTHEHHLKLICAKILTLHFDGSYEETETVIFWRITDFHFWLHEITKQYHTLYFVAHNMSYDITTAKIFKFLDIIGSKCIAFNPRHGNYFLHFANRYSRIIIIDSLNWFASSLEKLGKEIKFKKGIMPTKKGISLQWIKYCMRDVDIVSFAMRQLSQYLSQFGLGDLRITRASISFTIFRKKFHATNMLHVNNLIVLNLEYESYYGGRTEMFRHGILKDQPYFYFDFNSLYPSVMKKNLYSTKLRRHFINSDLAQLKRFIKNYGCIAKVKIKCDKPFFPKHLDGFTIFPIGTFVTTLTTPELKMALLHNMILKVYSLSVYQQQEIFTDFVEFFHKQKTLHKQQHKKIQTYFDKMILNTLYGKFGQKITSLKKLRGGIEEQYDAYDEVDTEKRTITKIKVINHIKYKEKKNLVSNYAIPSIACEVTSYARMKLLDVFLKIGWDHVYYCDTDSILTDIQGKRIINKLFKGHNLGKLVLENKSNYVELFALKDYNFGDRKRRKSIPFKSKKIKKNTYQYTHFSTTIESMKRNKDHSMITKKDKKTLSRTYHKGIVNDDGTISPISLNE